MFWLARSSILARAWQYCTEGGCLRGYPDLIIGVPPHIATHNNVGLGCPLSSYNNSCSKPYPSLTVVTAVQGTFTELRRCLCVGRCLRVRCLVPRCRLCCAPRCYWRFVAFLPTKGTSQQIKSCSATTNLIQQRLDSSIPKWQMVC